MKKIIKNYFKKLFEKYLFLVHRLLYILDLNLDYKYVAKTKHGDIIFSCSNSCLRSRAKTLLTKEPETIEWIDSFQENDVLYDIGANVGVYSLYAAIKKNKVVSFEPSAYNFSLLVKNIELNNFDSYIMPFNIALNDISKIDYLFMPRQIVGGDEKELQVVLLVKV